MKKQNILLLLSCILYLSFKAGKTIYYVDNLNGNDNTSGKSKTSAWKSLDKVSKIKFEPGDQVYLKRGQTFIGSLYLHGSGTNGNPIKLGAFGTGKRPIINSSGNEYSIKIYNDQYWEIADIETTGSDRAGIFIGCSKDAMVLNHFRITNCYVHDIGDTSKPDWDYSQFTGGIIIVNGRLDSSRKPVFYKSVFNDVIINDCTVRYNHRWTCISISSGKKDGKGGNAHYIKNCTAEYSAADGIRMNGVRNSFIEYCVMYRNGAWPNYPGKNLGGLGAWFFDAENCTIQFCEASYVQAATTDGGAFDIDYWQRNSTVQYCYGHDCSGYGVSVFGADSSFPTENSVVRYNLFSNNGRDPAYDFQGDFFVFTWNGGLLNGVKIHDNISYWNPVTNAAALRFSADFTGNNPNIFRNNIIYSRHSWLDSLKDVSLQCDSNIYWVTAGKPVWQEGKNKYYSLEDWQKATGPDLHSTYAKPEIGDLIYPDIKIPAKQFRENKSRKIIQTGTKSPGFSAYTVNKQKFNLTDYKGNPILLSFINIPDSSMANCTQAIRSQLAFIKSMKRQYAEKSLSAGSQGLKIILVDESYLLNTGAQEKDGLSNFLQDHELEDISLIQDNININIAAKYGVTISPTTFLLSLDGTITREWENVALPAQLALAIENEIK